MAKIEGDIGGLHAIATSLDKLPTPLEGSVKSLDSKADSVVNDAGWHGDAATGFRAAWERDAQAMSAIAGLAGQAAGACDTLATALTNAQHRIDDARDAAVKAGLKFDADNDPLPNQDASLATALTTYNNEVTGAQTDATNARGDAAATLYAVLAYTDPKIASAPGVLEAPDDMALAALLHDYVYLPDESEKSYLRSIQDNLQKEHDALVAQRATADGKGERRVIKNELKNVSKALQNVGTDLEAVSRYEDEVKLGKYFNTTGAGLLEKMGADSKWVKIADQIPGLDVLAATVGTYAQAEYDHDRGWGWTHAVVADGGANVVGIGVEVLTAETGPFAPVLGYAASSLVNEYTHNVHWSQNIHNDGVILGVGKSIFVDGPKDLWKNDIKGMADKGVQAAEHPVATAKKLWHGIFG
ncbi:hypothetical protein E6W39_28405 [Kitasatospora acidiphila]|uniref:WXG100 family type VII secretion target n=1 Tax=Kitasatospora acidiphila TaxID=2567942 RepID=A0A540W8U3_9ACTN|nr:hypothetical protein [Kitasatospora acidiphila]TQF05440.1 hypothetical protein E6W39_28405 [Kitasatospora acidiphila]